MDLSDVMDELSHAFLLESIKRQLEVVHDPEELRHICLELVKLNEVQKAVFKKMLFELLEDDQDDDPRFEHLKHE